VCYPCPKHNICMSLRYLKWRRVKTTGNIILCRSILWSMEFQRLKCFHF
jgi:hypothetical protein